MGTLLIFALLVAGLVFFAIEVFLIPGISLAGIASAISLLYAVWYAFSELGTEAGLITLSASAAGVVGVTVWFMRSKTVDRLSLKTTIDYRPNPLKNIPLKVGDQGITVTRLTLIGNAEFNGHRIEVKSAEGFIDEKTPVQISHIRDGQVLVKKADQ